MSGERRPVNERDSAAPGPPRYTHGHPDELRREVAEAGFTVEAVLGVEGPGWALPDLSTRWTDPARRAEILEVARAVESEPSLLGFHAHILAAGRVAPASA